MLRVTRSRTWLRNSVAWTIVVATGGLLYVNSMPAAADPEGLVEIHKFRGEGVVKLPAKPATDGTASEQDAAISSDIIEGEEALQLVILHLEKAHRLLSNTDGYTAKMFRQERVDGELLDEQVIFAKFKHEPFSVYMKWIVGSKGQEVLYREGQNNGDLIVKPGGLKGRFLAALSLDPEGSMAMAESRHPITKAGMLRLATELLANRRRDLDDGQVKCQMIDSQSFDDRDCICFVTEFPNSDYMKDYRKTVLFIDAENSLPILLRNYGWADDACADLAGDELDAETLVEFYAYREVRLDAPLTAMDFDRKNKEYRLR
ncbi:MAG: DUF1571 domain-containing protein [Planctomycetota bacterium]|nr:DUF1571 domain-containing protein [Planctomycetota bacterium]